ncbi:MAG: histidinol-phosphate transaminase, partial [Colwellia sp.]
YINNIKPYKVVSHKAWEFGKSDDVLKLDWNEATIPPSPKVLQGLKDFFSNGNMNWYPNVDNKEFRAQLAKYSSVPVEQVEYFASSDALHEYIIRAFINPGDRITMVAPTYDNFRAAAESIGAVIDFFYLDELNGFNFDILNFEKHVEEEQPKIVYLCNPNNPTGTVYSVELIENLVKRFNDVLFIIDEAYYEFSGVTAASLGSLYENIIVCRTFSKAFALASFRVGYAITSEHNMAGLRKIRNPKNITSYSQVAALAALNDIEYTRRYVNEVKQAKKKFVNALDELGVDVIGSESGNFVLVGFGACQLELTEYLEFNNIFVRNYGHVAKMGRYTRITIGTLEQMDVVFSTIKEFHIKNVI